MITNRKKGQEEIVGFVLIMVIVAVILVVFLGISIRNHGENEKESTDIYQFLESSGEITTGCQIREIEYADLGELFEKCYNSEECINELDSCSVLEEEMREILEKSWNIGENASIKGYRFESAYKPDSEDAGEEILKIENGACGQRIRGASYLLPAFPGKIVNTLKLCY